MPRIFPAEMMQDSAYAWLPRVQPKSQIIYTLVLGAVVAALIASIFIKVDVSVNVPGLVRPITEKSELRSLTSASISKVHVQEGEHVTAGQLLLSLKQEVTDNKLDQAGFELSQRETHMHDLALLAEGAGPARLYSNLYKQQYIGFQAGMAEKRSILDKLKSDFQMYNKLYEEKVIAKKNSSRRNMPTSRPGLLTRPPLLPNIVSGSRNWKSCDWKPATCRPAKNNCREKGNA